MQEETDLIHKAMQLTTAIALPMTLKVAMDLGLLDIIEKAGSGARLSPSEITSHLMPPAVNEEHATQMIDRILRLLSSYSLVTCFVVADGDDSISDKEREVERLYGLAPLSTYFVQGRNGGGALAPLFNMIHDKVMTDVWYNMKDAILQGKIPFIQTYGMSASEYIPKDERFAPLFTKSMMEFNPIFINKVLEDYKGFEGLNSIVDVGGGNGYILNAIISKYPHIKGINFDRPPVIDKSPSYPGIQNVAGDMNVRIPKGDAIFTKWVVRHLDDEKCLKMLKNCFEALPNGGKLMIVELVIPDIPDSNTTNRSIFQFDLYLSNMISIGGKERTSMEYQTLAMAAGFSTIQATITAYDMTLLEFHKILPTANKDVQV